MPGELEIEIKFAVDDPTSLRKQLADRGARRTGERLELNVFFDDQEHRLLAADQGLRLRTMTSRRTASASPKVRCVLTFKGPRAHAETSTRREIEVGVDDADATERLLGMLGLMRIIAFEKKREIWSLAGCELALDELPHLGAFLEIEGPSETKVLAVRDQLGFADAPPVTSTYAAMLDAYRRENRLADETLRM